MLRTELKSMIARAHHMLRKQPTLNADDIPKLYRESGVLTGYRLPGQPIFNYFLSAFQLNNETVNIWTHVVGFIVILSRIVSLLNEFGAEDNRISPIFGFGVCSLLNTCLSVTAHTFHSASPTIHYTCFQADYAGIGLYAFGGALPVFYLSADNVTRENLKFWFLPVNFVFSWLCFFCCCVAKLKHRCPYSRQRKLLQMLPLTLHMAMSMAPLHQRMSQCCIDLEICDDPGLYFYVKVVALALIAAVTFSSHLPEKLWPGHFDVIGQGHHVFHVVTVLMTLSHFDAAIEDISNSKHVIRQDRDTIPSIAFFLYVIMGLAFLNAFTIVALRPILLDRKGDDLKIANKND